MNAYGNISDRRKQRTVSNIKILKDNSTNIDVKEEKNIEVRPELAKACVQNGLELFEMQQKKNSLEDVFRSLTSAHDSENGVYDKNEEK